MDFRTIPDYPDYEASACGVIRRKERPSKNKAIPGVTLPARVCSTVAGRENSVVIGFKQILRVHLVRSAWDGVPVAEQRATRGPYSVNARPEPVAFDPFNPWANGRPHPCGIRGARVVTLAEHLEALRAKG